jgi:hypothetical protein
MVEARQNGALIRDRVAQLQAQGMTGEQAWSYVLANEVE